jgi:hypothetical protein
MKIGKSGTFGNPFFYQMWTAQFTENERLTIPVCFCPYSGQLGRVIAAAIEAV